MIESEPRLHGVLVTFRRPHWVARTLASLADQERRLDRLVIVDNANDPDTESIVREYAAAADHLEYLAMAENLGFTGGVEAGMRHTVSGADDGDWIVVLDDDDPPRGQNILRELETFGAEMTDRDPLTACVGVGGGRFDWRRGRIRRVADAELHGAIPLDYVGGNQFGFYRVAVVRLVGPFNGQLFFGLSEVEYGLRLRRAGYSLYGNGELWHVARSQAGRLDADDDSPSLRLSAFRWKRYYTLRNMIYLLRVFNHAGTALKVTLIRGFGKPLANLIVSPANALTHLRMNARACRDGWTNRMGRTVEPDAISKREL